MRLRGVGRRYGLAGPWVLRGVDLDVPPGSLTRVEGTNGSGKSTLLRLLAGIDAPTSGRITGRPRTAYVPERFPPELPFSVLGYLTHLGRVHGLGRAEAARGAGEWLERFGAHEYAATPLAELSKGTSQKVAVAQALLAAPALLVLDEAWTGLDRTARGVLDEAVAERVADGAAVVFVDHDPRRLAGAPDAVLRVADARLEPVPVPVPGPAAGELPDPGGPPAAAEPRIRVEAERPPGAALPANLPGTPVHEPAPAPPPAPTPGAEAAPSRGAEAGQPAPGPGDPRVVRLTVGAAYSDALLRALLTARPPWHIRAVTEVPADPETS
ncbi:ATP-binding cassette domain-containing protein [Streptomyces sp. NPDC007983]|uniref:ABC transporter ATP-binding protein n=1 Tax=Streptomyces sp. NPDC007983 TaxID=3364800 RepID=UPI0036E79E25